MAKVRALNSSEERMWRSFARILNVLPRVLDNELQVNAHISAPEYVALVSLADRRPDGLRVNDLAGQVGLSPSRTSRLADGLVKRGDVARAHDAVDARSVVLTITDAGLARLAAAWPVQLASVRKHVMDHIDQADYAVLVRVFGEILERGLQ